MAAVGIQLEIDGKITPTDMLRRRVVQCVIAKTGKPISVALKQMGLNKSVSCKDMSLTRYLYLLSHVGVEMYAVWDEPCGK